MEQNAGIIATNEGVHCSIARVWQESVNIPDIFEAMFYLFFEPVVIHGFSYQGLFQLRINNVVLKP